MKKSIFTLLAFIMLLSCQKEGEQITHPEYFEVQLKWFYTPNGATVYTAEIDGQVLVDSLSYGLPGYNFSRKMFTGSSNGMKRLVLKEEETDKVALDTAVMVSGKAAFELLAIAPDDRPRIMAGGGDENEPEPSDRNKAKFRYYYSESRLPDSVIMKFYSLNRTVRPFKKDEPSLGEIVIKRGRFSPYIELQTNIHDRNTSFLFELYNAATKEVIQPILFRNPVQPLFADGYSTPVSSTGSSVDGLPRYKFMTCILQWGRSGTAEKFYDIELFKTLYE
ncbi:hypothetical protein ACFOTA_18705 [Chitinophaga sp. GCM10012297]|uniref:DUF4843 domain-containing protein n=1 Tax=Chitinophaga chungangae TaxID=2821488 RepID=A0ABS3YIW9_9BACT|nr:hypothetical protein [Chitinophaga chungangae]MBO9154253.1 hypothetical protein [Chitinophaga chungangae]